MTLRNSSSIGAELPKGKPSECLSNTADCSWSCPEVHHHALPNGQADCLGWNPPKSWTIQTRADIVADMSQCRLSWAVLTRRRCHFFSG
eukprot:Skav221938  [mRNA]  locus=scaffold195:372352:375782:+ [translate_table: standard]